MKEAFAVIVAVTLLSTILVACGTPPERHYVTYPQPTKPLIGPLALHYVIDGDTFNAIDVHGRSVRYRIIGVDTPEIGERNALEAKRYTENFLTNKRIFVTYDIQPQDKFARDLVYVFAYHPDERWFGFGERLRMLNYDLVSVGLGVPMRVPPNTTYAGEFQEVYDGLN
jgi:endonuclease YncB( thermonuclease family)